MSFIQESSTEFDSARLTLVHPRDKEQQHPLKTEPLFNLPAMQQRLLQLLQTTLELPRVLELFFRELHGQMGVDGLEYRHESHKLNLALGVQKLHRCSYRMTHEGAYLGEVVFCRGKRFSERQLQILEALLGSLLFPLRNALLYRQAIAAALNDSLTGAGNRLALEQSLQREIQHSIRQRSDLSVIAIDLDHFKKINDSYGHAIGDEALKATVNCINDCLRAVDGVYRMGGEEFVAVLPNTAVEAALLVAERICRRIAGMQFAIDGQDIPLSASLGVATRRTDESAATMLERADQLMYQAKQNGRNCVVGESATH